MPINAGSWHVQYISGTERWIATHMDSEDKPQITATSIERLEMLMDCVDNGLWQATKTKAA